jgi:beta-N-acetylhexosaminidase
MTELDRLAAACLLPSFPGLTVTDDARRWLERGIGGVVLFARNVRDREQLAALTAGLRAERPNLLIAVDEEGGDVTRLEAASGSSYPGNLALGAVDDVELTEQVARAIGADLAAVGINLDLAPVADVNSNPRNPVIGVRSFGSDSELVARHVASFVSGLQSSGVAACAKHFPGHGDTEQDSHLELPVTAGRLEDALSPFRAAVTSGVAAVMTAHVRVPGFGGPPATLNRDLVHGLLRTELGFSGLVVTDALDMGAMAATGGANRAAEAALAAGVDALCLGQDLAPEAIARAIAGAVAAGRLDEGRLREGADRMSAAARAYPPGALAASGRADRDVGGRAARRALAAHGTARVSGPATVVEFRPEPSVAAGAVGASIGELLHGRLPDVDVITLDGASPDATGLIGNLAGRQLVLVLRDAHRHDWQRASAEALLAAAPDAIVVETGLPEWCPSSAGYLATHGAGRVNLEAAAEVLAGT